MSQKIKNIMLALMIVFAGSMVMAPAIVSADFKGDACQGVNTLSGSNSSTCSSSADTTIGNIVKTVVKILSIVVGFVAVIMIIVGGLKMITASGDSNAIASARTTIIYALVGLIIVAVAQILVHFVIFQTKSSQACPTNSSISITDKRCK